MAAPRRSQLLLWIFGRGLEGGCLNIYLPIGGIFAFLEGKKSRVCKEDRRAMTVCVMIQLLQQRISYDMIQLDL